MQQHLGAFDGYDGIFGGVGYGADVIEHCFLAGREAD